MCDSTEFTIQTNVCGKCPEGTTNIGQFCHEKCPGGFSVVLDSAGNETTRCTDNGIRFTYRQQDWPTIRQLDQNPTQQETVSAACPSITPILHGKTCFESCPAGTSVSEYSLLYCEGPSGYKLRKSAPSTS